MIEPRVFVRWRSQASQALSRCLRARFTFSIPSTLCYPLLTRTIRFAGWRRSALDAGWEWLLPLRHAAPERVGHHRPRGGVDPGVVGPPFFGECQSKQTGSTVRTYHDKLWWKEFRPLFSFPFSSSHVCHFDVYPEPRFRAFFSVPPHMSNRKSSEFLRATRRRFRKVNDSRPWMPQNSVSFLVPSPDNPPSLYIIPGQAILANLAYEINKANKYKAFTLLYLEENHVILFV